MSLFKCLLLFTFTLALPASSEGGEPDGKAGKGPAITMQGGSDSKPAFPPEVEKAAKTIKARVQAAAAKGSPAKHDKNLTAEPYLYLQVDGISCIFWAPGGSCEIDGKNCEDRVFRILSDLFLELQKKEEARDPKKVEALIHEIEAL